MGPEDKSHSWSWQACLLTAGDTLGVPTKAPIGAFTIPASNTVAVEQDRQPSRPLAAKLTLALNLCEGIKLTVL